MLRQASQQTKRARLEALRGLHAPLLRDGIPLRGTEQLAQSMALLFRDCLANARDKRRVLRAAELAHRLYDQGEARAPAPRKIGCAAGCDHCCHAFVSVLAPEAFLIAETLRNREGALPTAELFLARAEALRGLDQMARAAGAKRPCPALEEHLCSLHPKRPLSCRKHNSFSVEACRAAFAGDEVPIPSYGGHLTLGTTASVTLRAALKSLGLSFALYELSEAVSRILSTENALARWGEGEDVLEGVQVDASTSAQISAAIDALAAALA